MNQIKGNGFIITEENGNYTMSWMTGGFQDREVTYPLSKELVDKALMSEQDAFEEVNVVVEFFLQNFQMDCFYLFLPANWIHQKKL